MNNTTHLTEQLRYVGGFPSKVFLGMAVYGPFYHDLELAQNTCTRMGHINKFSSREMVQFLNPYDRGARAAALELRASNQCS